MALTLRPHQQAAANAVLAEFASADRANVIMPCASGKTLLEIRVANEFRRIVFLEPSLALIRQALQRAREDGLDQGRRVICVCSDNGVARDEWRVDEKELGIPVTTDAAEIRDQLERAGSGVLVFCTYQSVPLLLQGMAEGFEFDIGIFDESHRTAGAASKTFGLGLQSDKLRIRKCFFATATPRVYTVDTLPGGASSRAMHSMDDPAIYGRTVYRMSVREAIARGIICDYQVLVSATTEQATREACAKAKEMILPQGELPVELVASQLSVIRAAEVSRARRIVTYHSTIAEAQEFAADPLGLLADAGFTSFHIFGAMPSRQRQAVIDAFLACEGPALISNARCLSEGVDVPAIDLVALMNKRESVVDVVQILGRALRPYPGKETGYVMLPLFVDSEVAAEQALSNSDLAVTWEILHNILETEEDAVDLHRISDGRSQDLERQRGSGRKAHLRIVADDEVLTALERGITVRPVARLGHAKEQMLEAARQFRQREGHLRVPRNHAEGVLRLGAWLSRMKRMRAKGLLSPDLEAELVDLGVELVSVGLSFDERLQQLKDYVSRTGDWDVPKSPEWSSLRRFVEQTRQRYRKGTLSEAELSALDSIAFPFNGREVGSRKIIPRIRGAVASAGSVSSAWPAIDPEDRKHLRRWRRARAEGKLSQTFIAELQTAGIDLAEVPDARTEALPRLQPEDAFDRSLNALRQFVLDVNKWPLPAGRRYLDVDLPQFLRRQRKLLRLQQLSTARQVALDEVSPRWREVAAAGSFERGIQALREFRERHGHLRLPGTPEYRKLRWFVQVQRKRGEKMSASRRAQLAEIGFTWSREEDTWESHLAAMRATFQAGQSVLKVPAHAAFLAAQLKKHRMQPLPMEKLEELAKLGVPWAAVGGQDAAMLARVIDLSRTYGKVNLEAIMRQHPDVAQWVRECKQKFADGVLEDALYDALLKCGIRFQPRIAKV